MATLDEMNSQMTLYYSKSTGEIKNFCTGINDMTFFGSNEADFSQIWDYTVTAKDDFVLNNLNQFKINLVTKEINLANADTLSKYTG